MDILIGTRNQYKLEEMVNLLDGIGGIKVHYLDEIPEKIIVEEDQNSLEANAQKKAMVISRHTDWYVLASDGGNDIPGLGKKWDVLRNQRVVGETKTDKEKVAVLMDLMKGLKGDRRRCTYYLALALAKNGELLWSWMDKIDEGVIVEKPAERKIPPYLWMGHVWYYPKFDKTANELNENEKVEVRKQSMELKDGLQKFLKNII
jgi:inosine/xanthosine triphosphate pyrophosphatase family protein